MLQSFALAIRFLTVIPLPFSHVNGAAFERTFRRSVAFYPLVGAMVGAVIVSAAMLLSTAPQALRAVAVVAVWVVITGALHLDGLADVADAAGSAKSVADRQEILHDVQTGVYGIVAVVLLLFFKAAALISAQPTWGWILVPVVARSLLVWPMYALPNTPNSKLGQMGKPGFGSCLVAMLWLGGFCGAVVAFELLPMVLVLRLVFAVIATQVALALLLKQRLGGLGGDSYGALIEVTEIVGLMVLAW